ncbi:acyl-CoA dehydrogenase [Actinomadura sp. LD22]|uniref:Acyl-CoA dehydrogenase n=1 Tax=Actinomadura physcomitrii TaxID=2650748 RepID=A0A6I4MD23_9ACTN|nr:acyl-CoA dehydrogenase family protein [Actinomadura physcomitrii]MWA03603.1 acyl-CoA dehydrogenase [Actinomadura physcomitrii]
MDLNDADDLAAFREEARTWLAANVPDEPRPTTPGPALRQFDEEWQRCQYDGGWAGISWSTEYGGRGLSLLQQIIWYEELVRAGAPETSVFNVAFAHAGPTLIARGDERQKSFYLPRILRGETPWCQGFSEPESGSDLASLRCRGTLDGDELVISGTKIWMTNAEYADYCELLVRTDPAGDRHHGLSWVVMDMHVPGVDIRPIVSIDGWPHNCEVFFDGARVPVGNVVGGIGNGWSVAMSTLAAERGPAFLDTRLSSVLFVDEMIDHARSTGLLDDEKVYADLAELRAEGAALRSMAYYQAATSDPGSSSSETVAARNFFVQFLGRVSRTALEILGPDVVETSAWTRRWLFDLSEPIAGGTIDIQRNIIGERVLGLPR